MIDISPRTLTLVAAVGTGLAAGVFFAFSTFVMKALGDLPARQGVAAMQAINRAAPTPWFMAALFGTAAVCVGLTISAATRLDQPMARYQLAGSLLFLIGILVTVAYHVPHNDALARLHPNGPGVADTWQRFRTQWTLWNHVRMLTSLAGSMSLVLAIRAG